MFAVRAMFVDPNQTVTIPKPGDLTDYDLSQVENSSFRAREFKPDDISDSKVFESSSELLLSGLGEGLELDSETRELVAVLEIDNFGEVFTVVCGLLGVVESPVRVAGWAGEVLGRARSKPKWPGRYLLGVVRKSPDEVRAYFERADQIFSMVKRSFESVGV